MRRKIKFPLVMKDDVSVRTMEELRENFDLEKSINYYLDSKLEKWLKDRNYQDELDKLLSLDRNSIYLNKELCEALGVNYSESNGIDIKKVKEINLKRNKLKQYTDDEILLENIDNIMFDQVDLDNRLALPRLSMKPYSSDKSKKGLVGSLSNILFAKRQPKIYLCGDRFDISDEFEDIEYIGVNNPLINIKCNKLFDADGKNISFSNMRLTSNSNMSLKVRKVEGYSVDESNIKIENKINVKYNKTMRARWYSLIVVDEEGKVHVFGNSSNGKGCIPKFEGKIIDIDYDISIVVALDENGKVYQWGSLPYECQSVPSNLPKIKQVTVSGNLVVVLGEDGKIYYWGGYDHDRVFRDQREWCCERKLISKGMPKITAKIVQIINARHNILALDENGKIHIWGLLSCGLNNIPSNLPPIKKVVADHSMDFAIALDENGKIHYLGKIEYYSNNVTAGLNKIPKDLPKIIDISSAEHLYSALDENGKMHIWGDYYEKNKSSYEYIKKFPKLRNIFGHNGIDENGKVHGDIGRGFSSSGTIKLDNIKVMDPIG